MYEDKISLILQKTKYKLNLTMILSLLSIPNIYIMINYHLNH